MVVVFAFSRFYWMNDGNAFFLLLIEKPIHVIDCATEPPLNCLYRQQSNCDIRKIIISAFVANKKKVMCVHCTHNKKCDLFLESFLFRLFFSWFHWMFFFFIIISWTIISEDDLICFIFFICSPTWYNFDQFYDPMHRVTYFFCLLFTVSSFFFFCFFVSFIHSFIDSMLIVKPICWSFHFSLSSSVAWFWCVFVLSRCLSIHVQLLIESIVLV